MANAVENFYPAVGGAGTDPFSVMARYAGAFGTATGHTFTTYFQEDFLLGALTVSSLAGGSGAITYSTNATILGSGGIVKAASAGTTGDYAIVTSANGSALAADWTTSSYFVVGLCTPHGAMANSDDTHGFGFGQASTASGANKFVLFGQFKKSSTTNWGFTIYNGTTQTYHAGSTAFDLDVAHYLAIGHDATTNTFYGYVDGVLVDSVSDAPMVGKGAVAPYMIFDQDVTSGYMLCDKVYSAA